MTYERRFAISRHVVRTYRIRPRLIFTCTFCQMNYLLTNVTILPHVNCRFMFKVQNVRRRIIHLINFTILRFLGLIPSNRRRLRRIVRFNGTFTLHQFGRRHTICQRKRNKNVVTMIRRAFNSIIFTSTHLFIRLATFRCRFISCRTNDATMGSTMYVLRTNYRMINTRSNCLYNPYRPFYSRRTSVTVDGKRSAYATRKNSKRLINYVTRRFISQGRQGRVLYRTSKTCTQSTTTIEENRHLIRVRITSIHASGTKVHRTCLNVRVNAIRVCLHATNVCSITSFRCFHFGSAIYKEMNSR